MSFVSDEQASKALDWLVANARNLGELKRQQVLTESMTKRIKAIEMARSDAKTVAEKEREYQEQMEKEREEQEEAEEAASLLAMASAE